MLISERFKRLFEQRHDCEKLLEIRERMFEVREVALDGLLNTCSGCMDLKDGCKKIADYKAVAEMVAKKLAPLGLLDADRAWKKVIYRGGYALVGWENVMTASLSSWCVWMP